MAAQAEIEVEKAIAGRVTEEKERKAREQQALLQRLGAGTLNDSI